MLPPVALRRWLPVVLLLLPLISAPLRAERIEVGGDLYVSDPESGATPATQRSLFAIGFSVAQGAPVAKDAHVAGFRVDLSGAIGGDLYAAGGSLTLDAPVAGDASLVAASIATTRSAAVTGNARLSAGTLVLEGAMNGALLASGGTVTLNAPVAGDVWIAAGQVGFGPEARIGGVLHLATSDRPEIPSSVVPAERVVHEQLDSHARQALDHVTGDWTRPGPWTALLGAVVGLGFFLIFGAALLSVAPELTERLRLRAMTRTGQVLLAGVLGLSALVGLVPVAALTIVGIPLLPFIIVLIVLTWTCGYMLGVYTIAMRLFVNFGRPGATPEDPTLGQKLLVLAAGIVVTSLVNFIPVLGWIANVLIMLLGTGSIAALILEKLFSCPQTR
ncbi:hypothetical protein [Pseudooceanicola nanhaiensis]|uniref:hypothetical protein n=1 Tax=Pseudooceanicola nanhaiensis TaxID=375761 RepID=UPI001CD2B936|nr:hypothetical protein [Pseudooceanicola nanhaiensis]MCA0920733.1 hypothetical protein [Pseudooceanicola nanhaiensis]